jgi:hypothetical protein
MQEGTEDDVVGQGDEFTPPTLPLPLPPCLESAARGTVEMLESFEQWLVAAMAQRENAKAAAQVRCEQGRCWACALLCELSYCC